MRRLATPPYCAALPRLTGDLRGSVTFPAEIGPEQRILLGAVNVDRNFCPCSRRNRNPRSVAREPRPNSHSRPRVGRLRSLGVFRLDAVDFFSRMQALIENLVKLQAIELNRARLNQQMRGLPAEIAQAGAALAAAQRQSADLSAALDREDTRCAPAWNGTSTRTARRPRTSGFRSIP